MRPLRVEERRVRSHDGTEIAYHVVGTGLPVLLGNGLGGSWRAWQHQIAYLSDRYRFISWDYRGLYASRGPSTVTAVSVEHQARDGIAVLDAEGVERSAVFGWSMGVQVALEMYRLAPERCASLVLINGVAGNPWETVLGMSAMRYVMPPALRAARSVPWLADALTQRAVLWPETVSWVKRMGLASPTLDDELFAEIAASFRDLDMATYLRTLEALGVHDATDVLPEIDVPTLVITGDRDLFTPRRAAERIVQRVAGAELMVVVGGTHYVAVEYPELVNLRVEKFFRERGYATPTIPPGAV